MKKPELLAPAGDWKSFIAAVEAGADAVYIGGKDFSARSFATNLSREEIQKVIEYAHLRGVKCYAAVNTLVKDNEFAGLFDFINFLYVEGIDALIIQDLGVFNLCRKFFPDLSLHASTQMSAHNLRDVLELEKMGFKRVVLARELTLSEIQEIKNKSAIEIECFAHGALCFSYSGQCLLSSMIGGRSGNRGKCAQPCRKKYALVENKTGEGLNKEGYLLSTKDLCALDILDKMQFTPASKEFIDNGHGRLFADSSENFNGQKDSLLRWGFIDSLKIEGRMKNAAYVGGVVEKYRKAIDRAARNEKISQEEIDADKKELAAIFNRGGFSHGFLLEKKPKDLISQDRSKNFGVLAGEVIEARHGAVKIRTKDVGVNDGLEIWGRDGQEKNVGFRVEKMSGDIVNILIEGDVRVGDKVYKNYDYKLNKKLEALTLENYQKKTPVKMIFRACEGKNITLEIYPRLFAEGKAGKVIEEIQKAGVKAEGEKAESAIKVATSEGAAREQLARLGATAFFAEKIDIEIIGKVYIPLKNLNNLRRNAVMKLEKEIMNSFKREKKIGKSDTLIIQRIKVNKKTEAPNVLSLRGAEAMKQSIAESRDCFAPSTGLAMTDKALNVERKIAVQSDDLAVLDALVGKKISRIYTALKIDVEKFHKNNIEVFQTLPRILRKGEKLEIFENYDGFLVPALGYSRVLPPQAKKVGDFSLNIFNNYSVKELKNLGFSGFTASLENTLSEINNLGGENLKKEAIVYGYLPLMISESCVLQGTKYCKQKNFCVGVKDELGKIFPLATDCVNCRIQVLNSVPLYFTEIEKLAVDIIRIIHTAESPEKIIKIVDNYLSGSFGLTENTTTGHFYRGVE